MEDESRKKFGKEVQRVRLQQGLSQQEVADRADIKLATLQKIEAGKFNVPFDIANRIAVVLDCEIRLKHVK